MKKGTLVVIGVFVVLLVIVLATRERRVSVGVRRLELPAIDKEKVVAIEIAGPKAASLKKESTGWTVTDPAKPDQKHPADEQQINAALDAYKELKFDDLISDKPERHGEYDLDDSKSLKVKIISQGAPSVDLLVGKATKSGGFYIREPKSNSVYAAEGRFGWAVRKDANGWRKRSILSAKLEDVSEVTVAPKDADVYVLVSGEGGWKLKEGAKLPAGFRYDASAGQGVVQQLVNLRAQEFIDSSPGDEALGFSGPHSIVGAKFKDGKEVKLHLGNEQQGKESASKFVAARLEGDPQIYLLPNYAANVLTKKASDLRDLTLLSFDPQKVTKVSVRTADKKTVVAKEGDSWVVIEPKKLPAGFEFDPSRVPAQLTMLRNMKATRLVAGKAEAGQAGLGKPTTTVDLTLEDGKHQTLKFGKPAKTGKGKEAYVVGSVDDLTYAVFDAARARFDAGVEIFKKVPPPPQNIGGGMRGLESLPPDVRAKIEAQLRQHQSQ